MAHPGHAAPPLTGMRSLFKQAFYEGQRRLARLRMQWLPNGSRTKLPIFILHSLSKTASDMAVSEASFRSQLTALLEAGYRCMDLPEALRALAAPDPLPQPAFCLTFDDGYRNLYECGLKILEDLNLTATVFITVNFIEGRIRPPWHSRDAALLREYAGSGQHFNPLDWFQLCEMLSGGRVRIGSHSINHYLTGQLPEAELRHEIHDSKKILEDRLGVAVSFFSYPYGVRRHGAYSQRTEAMVREAGYQCSLVSEIGRASVGAGPWLLPRIPLVDPDTALDARAKAAGAYDWVAFAQQSFQNLFPNPHNTQ